jgi:hypothetical protein
MDSIRNSYVKPSRLIHIGLLVRSTLLSVGFVMNIQLQVDLKRDWIHDLFYIKLSHDLFRLLPSLRLSLLSTW